MICDTESDGLEITYKNNKIKRICTEAHVADKMYGIEMSQKIHMRVDEIRAAESIEEMIQFGIGRCHRLKGKRKEEYAVDLVHPYRMIFKKHGNEIQIAHITEIADHH